MAAIMMGWTLWRAAMRLVSIFLATAFAVSSAGPTVAAKAGAVAKQVQDAGPAAPIPMAADASPSFEVATIKPSDPKKCCARTFNRDGRRFETTNTNLQYLMQFAFDLQARQIAGGPPWFNEDRFDVQGEIDGVGIPNARQW